ncbi:MAG: glucosaminidase domain-containing protein [Bacteroidales bacterium]|nr:glucosaminidase domain-containing protein [Bacteroidales bacterium]
MKITGLLSILFVYAFTPIAAQRNTPKISREEYILKYKDLAIEEMQRTGIPASITLAQGMLESGNGNSRLAQKANNHFGIKCHDWEGRKIHHHDDARNECFRKYKSAEESYRDHSDFLTGRSRYASLFDLDVHDYKGWAKGLKKAGYATSNTYADALIKLIEENKLYELDQGVYFADKKKRDRTSGKDFLQISAVSDREVFLRNRIKYIYAKEGDTFENIAGEFDMLFWQLPKYNELAESSNLMQGQIIYLQPKRNKAEAGNQVHIVKEGETFYDIAQWYGIKLEKLLEKNLLDENSLPVPGQTLQLRRKIKNAKSAGKKIRDIDIKEKEDEEDIEFEFRLDD